MGMELGFGGMRGMLGGLGIGSSSRSRKGGVLSFWGVWVVDIA